MGAKDAVGRYGERVAARYLTGRGYEVIDRNWRGTRGELDLVTRHGDTLVVVEVKTRRGTGYGHPAEAVTRAKLDRIRRLTGEWLHTHGVPWLEVRVDVVAVVVARAGAARVEHLRGVL
ncbi:YraN family protein [Isoptericola halotolerans]|uniref:UPF0102 protein HDG69_001361 n=1 Tax=Isoptericola halotolerans TaxID=300560 RepID=A0ABX2A5C7_9MICO|nr:putative endonuclease [Isoptericola halotolerans]